MKIKCRPDDFIVEELTSVTPSGGPFAFYRLEKQSIGTPESIDAISLRWNVARQRIAYGGLKDRHAATTQFLTIYRGPKKNLKQTHFTLEYLGQVSRAFGPSDIEGNRFRITMRDIPKDSIEPLLETVQEISRDGLPNYFDDQRFGSLGESGEFIAQPWCLGNYERALWLALADDNRHDRPDEREQKRILRELWGRWPEAKEALARSHRRSVITFLVDHPTDFRRAFALIRVDMRRLYLSAFQSHLWNNILTQWLRQTVEAGRLVDVPLGGGNAAFWLHLSDDERARVSSAALPLPTARNQNLAAELQPLVEGVVGHAGMQLRELRVKYPRDSFFSKGARAAVVMPRTIDAQVGDDALYLGRRCIEVQVELPRGSYATILIKRLTLSPPGLLGAS